MNKNDLIAAVADKTTVQKSEVEKIIDATLDMLREHEKENDRARRTRSP